GADLMPYPPPKKKRRGLGLNEQPRNSATEKNQVFHAS
ncbi:MAG: hypothetical protein ACI9U2_004660, partial [Bradymonadia bacterium]